MMRKNLIEKFFKKVKKTESCWIWKGCLRKDGYGMMGWYNYDGHSEIMLIHRIAFEMAKGKIPKGKHVCHSCDNRSCVNPDHLWLGTQQGEKSPYKKLTNQEVNIIRKLYPEYTYANIGKMFGVCATTIFLIVKKTTWKHI